MKPQTQIEFQKDWVALFSECDYPQTRTQIWIEFRKGLVALYTIYDLFGDKTSKMD